MEQTKILNSNTINSIILVESPFNVKNLEKVLHSNSLIITFDYESHHLLSKKNIPHKTSECYLTIQDLDKIRQSSILLSKWYEQQDITEFVNYDGINLGKLFYVELNHFLSQFIKKFFEIQKICNTHKQIKYKSSSSLFPIISTLNAGTIIFDKRYHEDLPLYDSFKIRLTNSLSINISREFLHKLIRISEKFVPSLKTKYNEKSKLSLLVEFDPIRYNLLLKNSSKFPVELVLFNRRRPYVTNKRSYSIIKNSKCKIISSDSLLNEKLKAKIIKSQDMAVSQLKTLWSKNSFFESFFSIGGNSFWNIIKQFFIMLTEKRIHDGIHEIEFINELLTKYKISSIVVWSENGFNEQIIIDLGKKYRIPVFLIQHGLYNDSIEAFETNVFFGGIIPIDSSKFLAWGNNIVNYLKKCNMPDNKFVIIGSPQFDNIFDKESLETLKEDYILLATTSPLKGLAVTSDEIGNYYNAIKDICKLVKKMNKKLIIKIHPDPEELDISSIAKEVDSSIKVIKKGDITELIESCELFISIDLSTTILEAMIMKKPVIVVQVKYDQKNATIFTTKSCVYTKLENLENEMKKICSDVIYRKQLIEKEKNFVDDYYVNQGNASNTLLSYLSEI